jgi:hypothetical protein
MTGVRAALVAVGIAASGLMTVGRAQEPPPARRVPGSPPERYYAIDDQMFDISGLASPDEVIKSRPQGVTLDSDSVTWNMKFNGWEAGVIPVEFAADVTQAQQDQFFRVCNSGWGSAAQVLCIPRTTQNGYMRVTEAVQESVNGAPCFSVIGQPKRLTRYEIHLGPTCWNDSTVYHEQGHMLGFIHEHQRPDRDTYVTIDTASVPSNVLGNFTRVTGLVDREGPYDFLSIMHYRFDAFAAVAGTPTIIPRSGYTGFARSMGTSTAPTAADRDAVFKLYEHYFRPGTFIFGTPVTQFDPNDLLDAMERLNAVYYSRMGLNRSGGLSLNGKPDFQGIATWLFDIYLAARSSGLAPDMSFGVVFAYITQSGEWRSKHPNGTPATISGSYTPRVHLDRDEFLGAMNKLDAFYAAPEGLQRPNGLSIAGGPDFQGIATWIFGYYLNERLSGGSATLAWQRVVDAIRASDEWKRKH